MQVEIRYFYTNGQEMKQHDLVHLVGFVEDENANFNGLCRLAFIDGDRLTVYPLGQSINTNSRVEMYFEHIERLVKVDSREIDEALNKALEEI